MFEGTHKLFQKYQPHLSNNNRQIYSRDNSYIRNALPVESFELKRDVLPNNISRFSSLNSKKQWIDFKDHRPKLRDSKISQDSVTLRATTTPFPTPRKKSTSVRKTGRLQNNNIVVTDCNFTGSKCNESFKNHKLIRIRGVARNEDSITGGKKTYNKGYQRQGRRHINLSMKGIQPDSSTNSSWNGRK